MKATINGKNVTAETLDQLREIASQESSESWIYGEDAQGAFGFCNEKGCTCEQFMRYNQQH